jgi:sugar (pentulose or hexulose) kinase
MGLWIYQECKRYWDKQGDAMSFDELEAGAEQSKPFACFIDPDNDMFYGPGKMPEKVAEFCRRTGQYVPQTKAEIVRCVMESLALKYRVALEGLEKIVGYGIPVLHIVGGGSKNIMLCRFTANALGKPVITGPIEATAVGNICCQLLALGEVSNLSQAREIVRNSFPTVEYLPENKAAWDDAYSKYLNICE